ncbi:hypothetical protein BN14_03176 [Rhizoctonia solani AG-1 IB]|uniref:Mid2 domain-containing protein n=1 Tax=Thanatephorus cucumeris (strain AG1-IB / isolate 7/3/14) TaxID=1108050 RepID=M5BZS1_THACB|nr:hypothetical protein BN14_03176 [Rhizoctonia solani AG-1 IB]
MQVATRKHPTPKAPYHGVFYAGGYEPYRIQFNNTNLTGKLGWIANLPLDVTFGVSMFDVEDYTSGWAMPDVLGQHQEWDSALQTRDRAHRPTSKDDTLYDKPFGAGFVLDMSAGLDYWLVAYDSAGHSAVMGSYKVSVTSETTCLEAASTVTAGRFSTMYPGGTTTFGSSTTATATATSVASNSSGLTKPAIIGIAVGVPIVAITIIALLIWFCYVRRRQQDGPEEKSEIEPSYAYPAAQYATTPVAGSYRDASSGGYYSPPITTSYSPPPTSAGNRNTIHTVGDASTVDRSSVLSEKRRHLINPDAHSSGPINTEPFDPSVLSGTSNAHSELPPSPPAYSAPP